jgi:hypothetical protein
MRKSTLDLFAALQKNLTAQPRPNNQRQAPPVQTSAQSAVRPGLAQQQQQFSNPQLRQVPPPGGQQPSLSEETMRQFRQNGVSMDSMQALQQMLAMQQPPPQGGIQQYKEGVPVVPVQIRPNNAVNRRQSQGALSSAFSDADARLQRLQQAGSGPIEEMDEGEDEELENQTKVPEVLPGPTEYFLRNLSKAKVRKGPSDPEILLDQLFTVRNFDFDLELPIVDDGTPVQPLVPLEDAEALLLFMDLAPSDYQFEGFEAELAAISARKAVAPQPLDTGAGLEDTLGQMNETSWDNTNGDMDDTAFEQSFSLNDLIPGQQLDDDFMAEFGME